MISTVGARGGTVSTTISNPGDCGDSPSELVSVMVMVCGPSGMGFIGVIILLTGSNVEGTSTPSI